MSSSPQIGVQAAADQAFATVVYPRAVSPGHPKELEQQKTLALPPPPVQQASFDSPGRAPQTFSAGWPDPPDYAAGRTHVIADGDSLPKLAERYLGNAERGQEIFALNDGVLTHPDLLPIGVELKIPPRSAKSDPTSAWRSGGAYETAIASGLVPVYELPVSASVTPRAQLLRPVSPTTTAAPLP
jgi:LysM repeat protein